MSDVVERLERIESAVSKIESAILEAPKPWPELLCLSDISEATRIPIKTIYSMVRSGDLKAVRLGKSIWVTRDEFAAFVAAREAAGYEPYRPIPKTDDEGNEEPDDETPGGEA